MTYQDLNPQFKMQKCLRFGFQTGDWICSPSKFILNARKEKFPFLAICRSYLFALVVKRAVQNLKRFLVIQNLRLWRCISF